MANIKIFKMDDCSWYAAHNLMEFLNWYNKHIDSIEVPDDLQELEIIEPEDGTMWSNENMRMSKHWEMRMKYAEEESET